MTRAAPGSSPLARGLRRPRYRPRYGHGIIPARAGFTRTTTSTRSTEAGSSPLARGLPVNLHLADGRVGIIPARAGFTPAPGPGLGHCRDHPRSRGVYMLVPNPAGRPGGSSPLARGLRAAAGSARGGERIIPARAGFTAVAVPHRRRLRDHPRSRGVYADFVGEHNCSGNKTKSASGASF